MAKILGRLGSGQQVVDRHASHIHSDVSVLLVVVFRKIHLSKEFDVVQVDFDRFVGNTTCVATTENDDVIFAQRPNRSGLTRFVKNREPAPCRSVTVILKKAREGYVLISAFIGGKPEPEPCDSNATERSVLFWSSHALIWGSEEILLGTETEICPW